MQDLGGRLRKARRARGLTQAQMAQAIGRCRISIGEWENEIHSPSIEALVDISRCLDVSADWLLGLESLDATRGAGDARADSGDGHGPAAGAGSGAVDGGQER